jgi:uncharacterized membrane protein YcaP (DUF421 family)
VVDEKVMLREKLSHHELMAAVRQAGLADLSEAHFVILENNGHISVVAHREATK